MIRNALQPYSPAVLAWTFACIALACYAFARAFEAPVATWGDDQC